jgi:hypothetical protein
MTQWAVIEAPDENGSGEVYTHIMPIALVDGFKTKKEAQNFLEKVDKAGYPVITDDDGRITGTFFGHRLSKDCPCCPTPKVENVHMLVHHLPN